MLLVRTLEALRGTLPRGHAEYATCRERRVEIASYERSEQLVDALATRGRLTEKQGGEIVAVLILEHQGRGGPVWQTILALALRPALVRIRWGRQRLGDEDIDQDLLEAFLKAIRFESSRNAEEYAPAAITRYVERAVKRIDRRLLDKKKLTDEFDDETYEPLPEDDDLRTRRAKERVDRLLADVDPRVREMLLATFGSGETLEAFVARTLPDLDEKQRNRAYEQLRRARTRVVAMLRKNNGPAK